MRIHLLTLVSRSIRKRIKKGIGNTAYGTGVPSADLCLSLWEGISLINARELLFGNVLRIALFGGKRVSDTGYYVNGFFESP